MQFLQLDGDLKVVFHTGLSKILGENGDKMVLANLKEELVESTAMEL